MRRPGQPPGPPPPPRPFVPTAKVPANLGSAVLREGQELKLLRSTWPYKIVLERKVWPSAEHYYQAAKFEDAAHAEAIRLADTATLAWQLGQRATSRRPVFRHLEAIYVATRAKMEQNESLRETLVRTGEADLRPPSGDDWHEVSLWQHWYVRVLVRVREELLSGKASAATLAEFAAAGFDEDAAAQRVAAAASEFAELGGELRLICQQLGGRELELRLPRLETLHTLREQLATELGMAAARLKLVVGTEVPPLTAALWELGLSDGARIVVVVERLQRHLGGPVDYAGHGDLMQEIVRRVPLAQPTM